MILDKRYGLGLQQMVSRGIDFTKEFFLEFVQCWKKSTTSQPRILVTIFRVGVWQNGFFADFYFCAAFFFSHFVAGFFSPHFCGEKYPEKSSRKIPGKILQYLYNKKKSPTHFCRGAGPNYGRKRLPKDKVFGQDIPGISGTQTLGYPWPRPWNVPDKNFMQDTFVCCFRQGINSWDVPRFGSGRAGSGDYKWGKVKRPGNRQFRKLMGFTHGSLRHLSWHQSIVNQTFWVPWSFLRGDFSNPIHFLNVELWVFYRLPNQCRETLGCFSFPIFS